MKNKLTWQDIETAIDDIAKQIKDSEIEIEYIYGLPRGGMIPAVLLSHKSGIPLWKNIDYQNLNSYEDRISNSIPRKKILIIDEINDSGKTLEEWVYLGYPTATIHTKISSILQPTYSHKIVEDNIWQIYPWEQTK